MNETTDRNADDIKNRAKGDGPPLPRPKIKKMRWPFPIIWIVPVAAALLAGYYFYLHHQEHGSQLTITFQDVTGLIPDQTTIQVHGVAVGKVKRIELSSDHLHGLAHVQLETKYNFLSHQNTVFWIVRPEVSLQSVSGLSTLVTGPYIEARPGDGPDATAFDGLEEAPIINGPGLRIILHADQLGQLTVDTPVTYRGIQVGVVQDIRLSDDSVAANITLFIRQPYTPLIRNDTVFWALKGADIRGGIFTGLKVKLDSLKSILTGGVAFATPEENYGPAAKDGAEFFLNETNKDEWLKWHPKIHLTPEAAPTAPKTAADEMAREQP